MLLQTKAVQNQPKRVPVRQGKQRDVISNSPFSRKGETCDETIQGSNNDKRIPNKKKINEVEKVNSLLFPYVLHFNRSGDLTGV